MTRAHPGATGSGHGAGSGGGAGGSGSGTVRALGSAESNARPSRIGDLGHPFQVYPMGQITKRAGLRGHSQTFGRLVSRQRAVHLRHRRHRGRGGEAAAIAGDGIVRVSATDSVHKRVNASLLDEIVIHPGRALRLGHPSRGSLANGGGDTDRSLPFDGGEWPIGAGALHT